MRARPRALAVCVCCKKKTTEPDRVASSSYSNSESSATLYTHISSVNVVRFS